MTENERIERAAVVAEAKSWLGTKYHHRAMVKGHGVDCAMLPLAVYRAAVPHRMPAVEVPAYPHDWHLHRDVPVYRNIVASVARQIQHEDAMPGDFILYRWGRVESHGAILIEPGLIIHSYIGSGVVPQEADAQWLIDRRASFWTIW